MENKNKEENKQSVWELIRFAILAILVVVPIRIFIAQPFVVSGSSMFPTFENGEYLIVDEISYRLQKPERNDVIIFRYPKDTTKFYIKRIIGLPNETVDVKGNKITIKNSENTEEFELDQSYIKNPSIVNSYSVLGPDEYFVMGDNRTASSDSRYWGPVKKDLIIGRAFLRLLPFNKINTFPGKL